MGQHVTDFVVAGAGHRAQRICGADWAVQNIVLGGDGVARGCGGGCGIAGGVIASKYDKDQTGVDK